MVSATKSEVKTFVTAEDPAPKAYFEFAGLSTDSKPTSFEGAKVANGSVFLEMNTKKVYVYDEAGESWGEL